MLSWQIERNRYKVMIASSEPKHPCGAPNVMSQPEASQLCCSGVARLPAMTSNIMDVRAP